MPTTPAPDYLGALKTAMLLDGVLSAAAGGRVFVGELPAGESTSSTWPRTAVLVQPSGGLPELGHAALARPRIDVKCYGRSPNEAWRLSLVVHDFLKQLTRRVAATSSTGERALIHSATPISGGTPLREPDGDWPLTLRVYELLVSEIAVP